MGLMDEFPDDPKMELVEAVAEWADDAFFSPKAPWNMERFLEQARTAIKQQRAYEQARLEKSQEAQKHFCRIQDDPHLRDKDAEPPEKGWELQDWRSGPYGDDVTKAWGPPGLSNADLWELELPPKPIQGDSPLDLPRRDEDRPKDQVLPGCYVIVAVVHDVILRGKGFDMLFGKLEDEPDESLPEEFDSALRQSTDFVEYVCIGYDQENIETAWRAVKRDLKMLAAKQARSQAQEAEDGRKQAKQRTRKSKSTGVGADAGNPINTGPPKELGEAVVDFLTRVRHRAKEITKELDLALEPTGPFDVFPLDRDCNHLRYHLLLAIKPKNLNTDLEALKGYGFEPRTLFTCFSSLNPELDRSERWFRRLLGMVEKDVLASKTRPTPELVDGWRRATELLEEALMKAEAERDAAEQKTKYGHAEPGEGCEKETPQEDRTNTEGACKSEGEGDEPPTQAQDSQRPRCAPMTRTEIARRLLNRPKARGRDAKNMMQRHGLRLEDGNLYTICVDQLEPESKKRLLKPAS